MINPQFEDFIECMSTEDASLHLTRPDMSETLCGKSIAAPGVRMSDDAESPRGCIHCIQQRRAPIAGGADVHTETPPPYQT